MWKERGEALSLLTKGPGRRDAQGPGVRFCLRSGPRGRPPTGHVEHDFPELLVSRSKVTFEDKKRENFERGSLELEKRRQALLEQQRKEQERLAQLERAEQERKERERQEQERKRQLELERQLEKQRELERQREEERRKEIERREVSPAEPGAGAVFLPLPSLVPAHSEM